MFDTLPDGDDVSTEATTGEHADAFFQDAPETADETDRENETPDSRPVVDESLAGDGAPEPSEPSDGETDLEPDLDDHYWKLRNYVGMVADGETDALLLDAPPGIGKSYQITDELERRLGADGYIKLSGKITPVELFHALYEASAGKVLFLDDLEGVLNNRKSMALLKQATWTEDDDDMRFVEWRSTSNKIEVPEKFRFMGSVIMVFNETPDNQHYEALESRCLYYEMDFTHNERLEIIREIAKKPYKGLTYDERMDVVEWLETHASPGDELTIRTLFHIMDMRSYNPERWTELAVEQLDTDEELMLVRELVDEHDTIKAAEEAYHEATGEGRERFMAIYERLDEGV